MIRDGYIGKPYDAGRMPTQRALTPDYTNLMTREQLNEAGIMHFSAEAIAEEREAIRQWKEKHRVGPKKGRIEREDRYQAYRLGATKVCCHCGMRKPVADYNLDRRTDDGLAAICRACKKEYNDKYRQKQKSWTR